MQEGGFTDLTVYKKMSKYTRKNKKMDLNNLTPDEQLKYEVAEELGLLPNVLKNGWKSLSAKETGKIGGLVRKRKNEINAEAQNSIHEGGLDMPNLER